MRNRFLPIALLVILSSAIFISCGQGTTGDKRATVTIIGENSSTLNAMMDLEEKFEAKHPEVELDFKPNTFTDALEKSNNDFTSGTGKYDIILQYNFTLSPSVQNGYVYKIDDLTSKLTKMDKQFEKDIFPGLWQEVGYYYKDMNNISKGAEMISYPYVGISMVLMYNKKLFEDAANKAAFQSMYKRPLTVPATWEELYETADFFTNSTKNTFGICMEGNNEFLVAEWTNFLFGMGGRYMDKQVGWNGDQNTRVLVNSPESVKALEFYTKLRPFNAGNYTNVTQAEQMKIMTQGQTAMAIVWTDMLYQTLKTENGFDDRFAFTVIPGSKSILAGGCYFINKKSKFAKQAASYVVDQLQPTQQIEMARKGLCSPIESTYDDSLVAKIPYSSALRQSLKRGGMALEAGPDAMMITEVIATYIQKAWSNELSPKVALDKAQEEIERKRPEYFRSIKE